MAEALLMAPLGRPPVAAGTSKTDTKERHNSGIRHLKAVSCVVVNEIKFKTYIGHKGH